MHGYDHKAIEAKWQQRWQETDLYRTRDSESGKENYYALVEFPYPSGNLHIGHWYAFAVPDIFARYKRMRGYNVLFPFGFDSFGLPAENAAIKNKVNPREWTYANIESMSKQVRSMGNSFDWSRKIVTSDPDYYRWTQWLFLQFFKNGLAYRASELANWCPSCQTVLANEQVKNEACERCGTIIEKREQATWFLKITQYAERLLSGLDDLAWPDEIKDSQRNWIGKSEGAVLPFELKTQSSKLKTEPVEVFTTRPDTLFGATYLVLAPEHPKVTELKDSIDNWSEVETYRKKAQATKDIDRTAEDREKTGVQLEGIVAINPGSKEEMPVYIADYVLAHYGTGAIMAVPAHDERDYAFAKKFGLPIRNVINPVFVRADVGDRSDFVVKNKIVAIVTDNKGNVLTINCKPELGGRLFLGGTIEAGELPEETALRELSEEGGYRDAEVLAVGDEVFDYKYFAHAKGVTYRAFTKFVHLQLPGHTQHAQSLEEPEKNNFTVEWVPIEQAAREVTEPLHRHAFEKFILHNTYTGSGTLTNSSSFNDIDSEEAKQKITKAVGGRIQATYKLRDWSLSRQRYWGCPIPIVYDPEGNPHPVPDEHLPWTLPDDVDFTPTGEPPLARSEELQKRTENIFGNGWTPEVDTFDTFVDSSWYFLRYTDPHNDQVFATSEKLKPWMPVERYSGGAEHTTMHVLYSRFWQKALFDFGLVEHDEPYKERMNRGQILGPDGKKMSKSKGNVVDPDEHVDRVGADTVRLYLAFMGPYNIPGNYPFDLGGVAGMRRFLERIIRLKTTISSSRQKIKGSDPLISEGTEQLLHQTIKKVGEDIDAYKFNTALSQIMTLLNEIEKEPALNQETYEILIQLIAPFAPHLAEELWESIGHTTSIHTTTWPSYDEAKLIAKTLTIAIQVNGKLRGTITVPADATQSDIEARALAESSVAKWVTRTPDRHIYVPGRLLNVMLKP